MLNRMMANLPEGYRIVIDSTSGSESSSVGLVWHAELNRKKLLNGQVCSHHACTLEYFSNLFILERDYDDTLCRAMIC